MALRVTAISASAELGGTERVLLDFAKHSAAADIGLRVILPRPGPLAEELAGLDVEPLIVTASPRLLDSSQRGTAALAALRAVPDMHAWSRAIGAHLNKSELLYTLGFKPHFVSVLLRHRPTVWHLHEFPPAASALMWRFLARFPAGLIANSHATAAAWSRSGITVVPNGVDTEAFLPGHRERGFWHRRLGLREGSTVIGMPAAFARWKGQLEVIEAFERIAPNFPDAQLMLIGGPIYDTRAERDLESAIDKQVHAAKSGRVHRLGFVADIQNVIPNLDLVVHYSLRPEPFGRVVLEAMACGIPVIAAAEGGPLEILQRDGPGAATGGWLCEPRNPERLAALMADVLDSPLEQRTAIGAAGRTRAEELGAGIFAEKVSLVLRRTATEGYGV